MHQSKFVFEWLFLSVLYLGCSGPAPAPPPARNASDTLKAGPEKPPSSFDDSLSVAGSSAVFYEPDSLQLKKISAVTPKEIYESSMHEYFFQMRNARRFLRQYWPKVVVVHAQNVRYLVFRFSDGRKQTVDLNGNQDACGLYVFDGTKEPRLLDMMNVETQAHDYFSR